MSKTAAIAGRGAKNQNTNKMKVSELYAELGKLIEQGQGERTILLEHYYLGNHYIDLQGKFMDMDSYKTILKPRQRKQHIVLK